MKAYTKAQVWLLVKFLLPPSGSQFDLRMLCYFTIMASVFCILEAVTTILFEFFR